MTTGLNPCDAVTFSMRGAINTRPAPSLGFADLRRSPGSSQSFGCKMGPKWRLIKIGWKRPKRTGMPDEEWFPYDFVKRVVG